MESFTLLKKEFGDIEIDEYEHQNEEYEGMIVTECASDKKLRSRLAKKTPKKKGYFASFWKKNDRNQNEPFKDIYSPDFLVVVVKDGQNQGLFIFPKEILVKKNVLASATSKGRMAMRFYPEWCSELNNVAAKTQEWQLPFFKNYSEKTKQTIK